MSDRPTVRDLVAQAYQLDLHGEAIMTLVRQHYPDISNAEVVLALKSRLADINREREIRDAWYRDENARIDREIDRAFARRR